MFVFLDLLLSDLVLVLDDDTQHFCLSVFTDGKDSKDRSDGKDKDKDKDDNYSDYSDSDDDGNSHWTTHRNCFRFVFCLLCYCVFGHTSGV